MEPYLYRAFSKEEETRWWNRGRHAVISRLVPPRASGRVLSAGCGTGGELAFLSRYGKVFGVDPNEDAIRYCREAGWSDAVRQAPVEALPFADLFFDDIFLLDVLEHIRDEKIALAELHRVLKKTGRVVVTVPAYQWLWSRSDDREHHFRRYTKLQLAKILAAADFTLEKITYFNTFLFLPVASAKLLSRIREPADLPAYETHLPPVLNGILSFFLQSESFFLPYLNFPFGISILAIAKKTKNGLRLLHKVV